ncbi:MBL fold metallo-hydrolase [Halomarina ordinaria]|uniref:MBL fold metallo-hydrolase n=1 Tax=Halomarina ordinaria TaxID=3033939 RepID=A0ABD5UAT4_9EURY|nr:MBL fold metallo-hydrolase [Halomarina sp. PSRA2]
MGIGDLYEVEAAEDVYYVDTGMYDTAGYGVVYIVDAERPALVDTGLGTRYEDILDALSTVGIAPEDLAVIAPTHVHLDHAGGAGYLARECENADVYIHEIGAPHLADPSRLVEGTKRAVGDQWEFYADPLPVDEERLVALTDGDVVDLGDRELRTHHTPGHAPHQMVYELPDADLVFTADAAGIYVPPLSQVEPTSPPPNFDLERCLDDVDVIRDLDPETLCYAHFGPTATDDRLAEYESVLSEWIASVEAVRADLDDDEAVAAHFADETADRLADVWGERKAREEGKLNVRGALRYLDVREE